MLELRAVSYRYPGDRRRVLEAIDLAVGDGEIVGLVGPTDSGKSTLCLVASGLAPASLGGELTGEVVLDGQTVGGPAKHEITGRVGIVVQDPGSQRSGIAASVFEEVALGPVNLGLPVAETVARVRRALDRLGIGGLAERDPARLSGGEAQLVAIAAALAMEPRHLVLDEPTAELDPLTARRVGSELLGLAADGIGVLIASHDTDLLDAICGRVVALSAGRVVLEGPAAATLRDATLASIGVPMLSARRIELALATAGLSAPGPLRA